MSMKTSLHLSLNHQLALTPQLQQAIHLLQLSTQDLEKEVEQVLEANPLLERYEPDQVLGDQETGKDSGFHDFAMDCMRYTQQITGSKGATSSSAFEDDGDGQLDHVYHTVLDLKAQLMWQIDLGPFSDIEKQAAVIIVDALDKDGFLTISLSEVKHICEREYPESMGHMALDFFESVLNKIQHCEPIGVGARNLKESLLIQLRYLPEQTPYLEQMQALIHGHLDELAAHQYKSLMKKLRLSEAELKQVIQGIRTLDPHPGSQMDTDRIEYITPDILVQKDKQGEWQVHLNPDVLPKLRINREYSGLLTHHLTETNQQFLKSHLQEARWFIKSLNSRHETLLKVARCIVTCQKAFFDYGDEAMKPLVLHDVAQRLSLHESTISRVTTQKYMHTPRGIFELKYFFSSHVATRSGGECSSTAIRAVMKKLIASENPRQPLSDHQIASLLAEQGIMVARRTIAKYREAMHIPASSERRSLVDLIE